MLPEYRNYGHVHNLFPLLSFYHALLNSVVPDTPRKSQIFHWIYPLYSLKHIYPQNHLLQPGAYPFLYMQAMHFQMVVSVYFLLLHYQTDSEIHQRNA